LSKAEAATRLSDKVKTFQGGVVTITDGSSNLRIPIASLGAAL